MPLTKAELTRLRAAAAMAVEPDSRLCRPAMGDCDLADYCDGGYPFCDSDHVVPAGTPCRARTDTCDDEEFCDGVSGACPPDSRRC